MTKHEEAKNWKPGDLVFVNYNNRYYAEVLKVEASSWNNNHYQVTVRRLYDEYGGTTHSRIRKTYDPHYITLVDKGYIKKREQEFQQIVRLYEEHNGQRY